MKQFNHGLSNQELAVIKEVLKKRKDKIDSVAIFGSRATGLYKPYSDIDMALFGKNLTQSDINQISTDFDDSSLAYSVDLCAYHLVTHKPFKEHIDQVKKTLFEKHDLDN